MDTTTLGQVAAELMEVVAEEYGEKNAELGTVMVLAEVQAKDSEDDEDLGYTSIAWRCSDERGWVQRGLLHAALDYDQWSDGLRDRDEDG